MSVTKIATNQEFTEFLKKDGLIVVHFMAEWAAQCGQMNDVIAELSKQPECKDVRFVIVHAEDLSEVSLKYKIAAVPTFLLLLNGNILERVDGANSADLTSKVKTQAARASLISPGPAASASLPDLNTRLKQLINSSKCILFMKGTPDTPRCGFSRTTVDLLNKHEAEYSSFDILSDEEVRQGLKSYSNWPTYPQLYIDGELIGGLDILREMDSSGELSSMLPKKQKLEDRLPYETFDILTDEEVRQGLKTFSNWPTYPQVYVKGELVGGLDIIKELQTSGELMATLKGD